MRIFLAPVAVAGALILAACGTVEDGPKTANSGRTLDRAAPSFVDEKAQPAGDANREFEAALKDCGGTSKLSTDSGAFERCFDQHSK